MRVESLRRRSTTPRDERGSATVFVLGLIVALFGFAGLVIDGGDALNQRGRLADTAEQAARAGADQVDIAGLRASDGTAVTIDRGTAPGVAEAYMAKAGFPGARAVVSADGRSITVSASSSVKTTILQIVGVGHLSVAGSATATAEIQ